MKLKHFPVPTTNHHYNNGLNAHVPDSLKQFIYCWSKTIMLRVKTE